MTILLIRPNRNEVDAQALNALNIPTISDPYLTLSAFSNPEGVLRMKEALSATDEVWLIITSPNALQYFEEQLKPGELKDIILSNPNLRFAAIGDQTEAQLIKLGAKEVLRAKESYSESLANLLITQKPAKVVIPSGSISMKELPAKLLASGFTVIEEVVYLTNQVTKTPRSVNEIKLGNITGVLLRSPSAARAFVHFVGDKNIYVFCAGKTTAATAIELGLPVSGISMDPTPEVLAKMIFDKLKGV
jgi:uroporphyrinogen-III synthase